MGNEAKSSRLPADNPIRKPADDLLGRMDAAKAFAQQVLALDVSEGAAVGVFGPWGAGKTSFVNLARSKFDAEGVPVLDFNPWLFTGTEQLITRFFAELSAELKLRDFSKVGNAFSSYGDALTGGHWSVGTLGVFLRVAGKLLQCRYEGVGSYRNGVEKVMSQRRKPIVIVLDDVDRLPREEIRNVFRLVRLTAIFPNLIYIVPCDRHRIERALDESEQGLSGSDYLEKIIQFPYNLPEIPAHILHEQIAFAIEDALASIENTGPFDEQAWPDIHVEIVRPLIQNMRDLRRYAIAIRQTVAALDGQVALADVLALEAVRVFLPSVFRFLPTAIDGLTGMSRDSERYFDRHIQEDPITLLTGFSAWHKARIETLISAAEKEEEVEALQTAKAVVVSMIDRLFPAGAQLRQMSENDSEPYMTEEASERLSQRRVAHEHVLRLYLERAVGPALMAFRDAERALARMGDHDELNGFTRSLDPARWQDVLSNLCRLEEKFRSEHVEPGSVMLLNLWPDMPERSSGSSFLDDSRGAVRSVVLRLLRALEDAAAVETAVRRILPQLTSLSAKVELVLLVGYQKDTGYKLVSESAADKFATMLCEEIKSASVDDLAGEYRLWRVLYFAKDTAAPGEAPLDIYGSPEFTFALLRSVYGETITGSLGNRAVSRSPTLKWNVLVDLYGGEKTLKVRIESLNTGFADLKPWIESKGILLDEAKRLLELANTYVRGQRPESEW